MAASLSAPAGRSSFGTADLAQLALLGAIWGLTPLIIKTVVTTIPPLWLVAGRSLSGLVVVLLFLRARGRRLPPWGRVWVHFVVLGTIGSAVPWALAAWAQQSLSSSLGAVLAAPIPAATLVIGAAAGVEQLTRRRVVGLVLATAGTLAVVGGEVGGGGAVDAVVAFSLVTLMWGFGSVYTKRTLDGVPGLVIAAGQFTVASLVLIPLAAIAGPAPTWGAVPVAAWLLWLTLGGVSTGWAFAVFYDLMGRVGPTVAQMTCYVTPIVGAVAGWVILREPLGIELLAGGTLTLVGMWLVARATDATDATAPTVAPVTVAAAVEHPVSAVPVGATSG